MIKAIIGLICSVVLFVNISGCIALGAAAGGAGAAMWLSGKLSDEMNASYDKTIKAAEKSLKSMKMEITKQTQTEKVTQIMSKYTDGRTVWIDIRPVSQSSTKVEIRVGMEGDKLAADKIMKGIRKYL